MNTNYSAAQRAPTTAPYNTPGINDGKTPEMSIEKIGCISKKHDFTAHFTGHLEHGLPKFGVLTTFRMRNTFSGGCISKKHDFAAHFIGHLEHGLPKFGVLTTFRMRNTFSGEGIIFKQYEGCFEKGIPHGLGKLTINNKTIFVGRFIDGLPKGDVELIYKGWVIN